MNEPFDWSKIPTSQHGDDVWFRMVLPEQIAKLRRLHEVINKWRAVADTEFASFQRQCEQNRKPAWGKYGYDPVQDEAFMLLETERVMFANLGVSIASCAENFIVGICKSRGNNYVNNAGESHYGIACKSLSSSLNVEISDLPGHAGNQRARMLGNCFKHSEGKANEKFATKYSVPLGEPIEFEKEDWSRMIVDTQTLLSEIVQRLSPR
jgi:hypothetical protein